MCGLDTSRYFGPEAINQPPSPLPLIATAALSLISAVSSPLWYGVGVARAPPFPCAPSRRRIPQRPHPPAAAGLFSAMAAMAVPGAGVRWGFATQPATILAAGLVAEQEQSSRCPHKETILDDGCDFEHWLVVNGAAAW